MAYINKIILPDGNQYDIQVKSENIDGVISVQKGGTGVNSIEEAKQIFNLDAGDIAYDDTETYDESTVGDGLSSLKADIKLVKGMLGFVTPDMFGAIGDGITDDTTAVKGAIDYAIVNNFAVFIPQKTYIVDSAVLRFDLTTGQSLIIFGTGEKSVIKRKPDSLVGKWSRLFDIRMSSAMTSPVKDVIFWNFYIDSNRRGQSMATSGYDYEASADIAISNGSGTFDPSYQYIDRVIIRDMRFFDPVADCFNFSGSGQVYVKRIFIENMVATDRQGTRNDIGFTGNPLKSVSISNCDVGSIHFEYNQTVSDENIIPYNISNCNFGACTLGARIDLNMSGCNITNGFALSSFRNAFITGCKIILCLGIYTVFSENGKCVFDSCLFTSSPYPESTFPGQEVYSFNIRPTLSTIIRNCEFRFIGELTQDFDEDGINDHILGDAIVVEVRMVNPVIVDNCYFDEKYRGCIKHQTNNIIIKNMLIDAASACSLSSPAITSAGVHKGFMKFENIKLGDKCLYPIYWGAIGENAEEEVDGTIITKQTNFMHPSSLAGSYQDTYFNRTVGTYKREVCITEPLTLSLLKSIAAYSGYQGRQFFNLFKGDTFIYIGNSKEIYPQIWVVKDTGRTTLTRNDTLYDGVALEDRIVSVGSGYGTTANRPVCFLSKGFNYYDTDLEKLIMWNGSAWVNLDGTAL